MASIGILKSFSQDRIKIRSWSLRKKFYVDLEKINILNRSGVTEKGATENPAKKASLMDQIRQEVRLRIPIHRSLLLTSFVNQSTIFKNFGTSL